MPTFRFAKHLQMGQNFEVNFMKRLFVLILVFASFAFRAPTAYGSFLDFQNLVVFGDSLSDNGNTFSAVGLPKSPYYEGRWTNGPNWVDYFSQLAGIPDVSAFLRNRGTNFAVGGSTSVYLAGEIATYLATNGGRANPANLYVVWIGANDFEAGLTPQQTSAAIETEVVALREAGAKHLLLLTVPDISLTPEVIAGGGAEVQAARQFVATANSLIRARVLIVALLLGLDLKLVDINPLLTELVYTPSALGFTNSVGAAYNTTTGVVVHHPNDYVFWDGFHPTTRVHYLAAQLIYQSAAALAASPKSRLSSR
jgi:thermolabile hemolysin